MALALFDLDETLIAGDSSGLWMTYLVEQGIASEDIMEREAKLMDQYYAGTLDMHEYIRHCLHPIINQTEQEVASNVARFIEEQIRPIIYPEALACLAWHKEQGNTPVVISATGEFLVAPIAKALGVGHAIAILVETADGKYTGESIGTLSYREGKVTRLHDWMQEHGASMNGSYFYSDSRNDLPLLRLVDNPVATNPDDTLLQEAQEKGWSIENWKL